jgi:hypothetical protein
MSNNYPYYSRLEFRRGTLTFANGVDEIFLTIRVFKRQYYEYDDSLSTFAMYLSNPSANTEIGDINQITFFYYDDPLVLNDAYSSYAMLNTTRNI